MSWAEFLDWELWQIGAALGMDRIEPTSDELALVAQFEQAAQQPPSPDRQG